MQKSDELKEVITLVINKLQELGMTMEGCVAGIYTFEEDSKDHIEWVASPQFTSALGIRVPYFNHPVINEFLEFHEKRDTLNKTYSRELKDSAFRVMYQLPELQNNPEIEKEWVFGAEDYSLTVAFEKHSAVGIASFPSKIFSDNEIAILKRFARVFEQTYIRFLDLKKAEAQAREAQIEAALERVRSRSMGMHKSNELKDVVRLLYKEFRILETGFDSVNIQLNLDSSKDINFWASVEEDVYPELYHLPYSELPIFEKIKNAFNSPGEGFFEYSSNKEEKNAFFSGIFKVQPVPLKRKKIIQNAEGMVMMGWFHRHSGIDIVRYNLKRFSEEEKDIVKRFAAAFEQTYIRFTDLQKAETQAREAIKQASLDRVRSEHGDAEK